MSSENPLRILRIIARLNIGGPAIQAILLSEHLFEKGYQTLLISGKVGRLEGDMSYLADTRKINFKIISHLGRDISLISDLKTLISLIKIIKKFNPHIIHTHTAKAGTIGRLAGMGFNFFARPNRKIKLIHTFHGHVFHGYFNPVKSKGFILIERLLARFTDRIIVISALQKEDICKKFKIAKSQKVRVVPLGFDLKDFSDLNNEKVREKIRFQYLSRRNADTLLLGIVGRLTSIKNHHMFLRAIRYLKDAGSASCYQSLIIGGGELYDDLVRLVDDLEISESVIFTGWQKGMASFYKALDVVALTSKNEGTPVTLIEAMAAKKPVIATDVGGVRDLMGPVIEKKLDGFILYQNGITVPSERFDIFANALTFLFHNQDVARQMADRAQKYVLQHYSEERLFKDIDAVYRNLI
jgi:glycosyltransferase involved in cell wall biosynthesis